MFSVARIGQVHAIFRAHFADPGNPVYAAGTESLDVALFGWNDIPWDEIAFPSVRWALDAWKEKEGAPLGLPIGNPASDPRGMHRSARPE